MWGPHSLMVIACQQPPSHRPAPPKSANNSTADRQTSTGSMRVYIGSGKHTTVSGRTEIERKSLRSCKVNSITKSKLRSYCAHCVALPSIHLLQSRQRKKRRAHGQWVGEKRVASKTANQRLYRNIMGACEI